MDGSQKTVQTTRAEWDQQLAAYPNIKEAYDAGQIRVVGTQPAVAAEPPARGSVPSTTSPGITAEPPARGNLPTTFDPVAAAVRTATPIDTLASMVAQVQGSRRKPSRTMPINIAQGISGLLQGKQDAHWAEAYLNDTARLAWARENQASGKTVDPRDTPVDYIETWKDAFYGSDHNVPLVKELDQQMIDYAASKTPANKPFDWHLAFGQNGEKGLISQQFTQIDCGPNAFATIARSRGVNMTPEQALPFAERYGYHNGSEFTGPENYARMLRNELGLDAKTGRLDEVGWSAIDKELAEGRPVTLSSPGHYWVVTGKNDQGQYYAGATNTFLKYRQGQNWVDKGAFSFGGPADTYITAKGDVNPQARAIKEMHLQPPAMTMQSTRENLTQRVPVPRTTNTLSGPAPTDMNQTLRDGRRRLSQSTTDDSGADQAVADNAPRGPIRDLEVDPRLGEADQENVWSDNQPVRHSLMTEFQQRPKDERQAIFETAMDQGLDAEGITGAEKDRWKTAMREITQGGGRLAGVPAEDPDLNPFMISGEAGGTPARARGSSATGYFQLIGSNPSGSDFGFRGYIPKEYGGNRYHPVAQVRQFVRAINASSNFRGNPDAVIANKRANGHYNIIIQPTAPW
jgi:hypothetical protein